jgi:hypothetical protein
MRTHPATTECFSPTVDDRTVHRIARDKDHTDLDSPGLLADSEPTLAFQDQHDLVVIWLDVDDIPTVFENVDVARDVLPVTQERTFDRVRRGCWVGREATKSVLKSMEVLRVHGGILFAAVVPT